MRRNYKIRTGKVKGFKRVGGVKRVKVKEYRGGRKMSSVSERLQVQLANMHSQKREEPIIIKNGHLVLTTNMLGKSLREQYLEEQGYDID